VTKIRIVEFISFSFLLNLAVGVSAEIYTNKQDCLVKNGSDASWLCDNLVYGKLELKEVIKTTKKETGNGHRQDKYFFEYCRERYNKIPSYYSESRFRLDFPQCQELIPALRVMYADENQKYCQEKYKQAMSNYYSESRFRLDFPQCQELIITLGPTHTNMTQEYCRERYKQLISSYYSESKFRLDFPQCQELIPNLRAMYPQVTNQLLEYCVSQYKWLSKSRSDLNYFSSLYPECSYALSSIKNQILKENQDLKPQPATKELDQKNSKQKKEKYAETNNVSTPATKVKPQKAPDQEDAKKKNKK